MTEVNSDTQSQSINVTTNGELELPIVEVLAGRTFVTGKSGSGKSNTASVIIEELLNQQFPVLIVEECHEYIQQQIDAAKQVENVTPRYVTGVVKLILQNGGRVTRREVTDDVGIKSAGNIGKAMKALSDQGVVELSGAGDQQTADFAFKSVQKQYESETIMESVGLN